MSEIGRRGNDMTKALVLIDLQNDFMPGGSLAVPNGHEVVEIANKYQSDFDWVIATQDWHPENHTSFKMLWPVHCVQNSYGAELHKNITISTVTKIIYKGVNRNIDSYSAFFDNEHQQKTELDDYLKSHHITHLYIMGLATEYCVKFSVLDACQLGYHVFVIKAGCRGLDVNAGKLAFEEMEKAGAVMV